MGPLRRWRPLIMVAAIWLAGFWYFWGGDDEFGIGYQPGRVNHPHGDAAKAADSLRWTKRADRYPVESLRPLPAIPTPAPEIPKIQKSPRPEESNEAREEREMRLAAVRASFEHSWTGYKTHAWLHDEVAPLNGAVQDPFGGWAATLVDALDTLWIMGMKKDFERAVKACDKIDFSYTPTLTINIFETTIRYLGGFLAAYELSEKKYPGLLRKAVEVGELLMGAFDTPNRMPISRWDWREYVKGAEQTAPHMMLVSEIGSFSLEFTKLSQLTGDMRYYDAAQRVSDEFERSQQETKLPGMWPIMINAAQLKFDIDRSFTLGGMSDSLYEYFPKQYLMLGGALKQPRVLYEGFIDVAKKHLFRRALNKDNVPLLISGDAYVSGGGAGPEGSVVFTPKGQHLTCFTGGMLGISSRIFSRPEDLEVARQLTDACVWSYAVTASGIGPEIFTFVPCGAVEESQTGENCTWSEAKWHAAVADHLQIRDDDGNKEEVVLNIINKRRLPPGMVEVNDRKYILRPEAIESVFIMYRLTGDRSWMDKAWTMFEAVEKATRTTIAAASLDDVTRRDPHQTNSMESFWLAETLKYFYLAFSDWDVVDLDQWVLNTEAHPLRRPGSSS